MAKTGNGPDAAPPPRKEKRGTRMRAVVRALDKLGPTAMPVQIQEYLRRRGLEMDASVISNYKGTILKRRAASAPPAPPSASRPAAASPDPRPAGKRAITVADVRAVKELAGRLGADIFLAILDLVS